MTSQENALESSPPDRGRQGPSFWRLGLFSFVAAALVRASPWQTVFTPGGVLLHDGDGYAHMWRIWNAAAGLAPLSARDSFTNFPDGGEVIWPPLLDGLLAFTIATLGLDRSAAEVLCAWVPLVLGAFAVVLAAWWAASFFSVAAGWVTGLLLAVLPGSFLYTQLGYLDHHAAVTLIGTALLGGAMSVVAANDAGPRGWSVGAAVLAAVALLIWSGALLHLLVLQAGLLLWAVAAHDGDLARARTARLAFAQGLTAIGLIPFSFREWEIHGAYSPLVPSLFQVVWLGAGAVALFLAWGIWAWPAISRTRPRRLASATALAGLGVVAAFAFIPELARVLSGSASWFTGDVDFLVGITELAPLTQSGFSGLRWGPFIYLSPLILGFPVACLWLCMRRPRPEVWLLTSWAIVFLTLTLNQLRFVNTFVVAFAIVMGAGVAPLLEAGAAGKAGIAPSPEAGAAGTAGARFVRGRRAAILLVIAAGPYYARRLLNDGVAVASPVRAGRIEVARFLRAVAPDPFEVGGEGELLGGVLGSWDAGRAYRYYSGWPVHQDGFGPYVSPANLRRAADYFSALDEGVAIALLSEMPTRFVIVDRQGAGRPPTSPTSMTARLVESRGSSAELSDRRTGRRVEIPALTRHRLRYGARNGIGGVWLYEVVPGATLVGTSEPGATIAVSIELGTPWGGTQVWRSHGRADGDGTFRMRVPYATRGGPETGIAPRGAYRVRAPEGSFEVHVDEAEIQAGRPVAVVGVAALSVGRERSGS